MKGGDPAMRGTRLVILAAGLFLAVGCMPTIDALPENAPRGFVKISWNDNPGFPLVLELYEGDVTVSEALRPDIRPSAVYRSGRKKGGVRFAASPGDHTLLLSSIGDAETLSPFAGEGGTFGPLPVNERERLSLVVHADRTVPVRIGFERQDTWSDWEGDMPVSGTYLIRLGIDRDERP